MQEEQSAKIIDILNKPLIGNLCGEWRANVTNLTNWTAFRRREETARCHWRTSLCRQRIASPRIASLALRLVIAVANILMVIYYELLGRWETDQWLGDIMHGREYKIRLIEWSNVRRKRESLQEISCSWILERNSKKLVRIWRELKVEIFTNIVVYIKNVLYFVFL